MEEYRMKICRETMMLAAAAVLAPGISGCATLVSGTHETISVSSDPPDAEVRVIGRDDVYRTPARIRLHRSSEDYLFIGKQGYHTERVYLERDVHMGTVIGFFAFMVPAAVDVLTGAFAGHAKGDVHVVLSQRHPGEILEVREWRSGTEPRELQPSDRGVQ
jgi:hypothetical protein